MKHNFCFISIIKSTKCIWWEEKKQVQRNLCWNVSLSVCGWQKKTAESWQSRFGTDENKSRTTKGPINVHVATIFITDIKIGFKRLYYWLPAFNRKQSKQKRKCRRRKKNNSKTHEKQFFFIQKKKIIHQTLILDGV